MARVSNHQLPCFILRDAAKAAAPQDEGRFRLCHAAAALAGREIVSVINAAMMHSAPAAKNAGR
jgi:hypothetical protein